MYDGLNYDVVNKILFFRGINVMIRKLKKADINKVVDIWLDANLKAHYFISEQYWKSKLELVKELLPQAEVYVYDDNEKIHGFVGLNDEYIEGIFVSEEKRRQGIGRLLLNYIKKKKKRLFLNVYQKNTRAIHFYKKARFKIKSEGFDKDADEKDYLMMWKR